MSSDVNNITHEDALTFTSKANKHEVINAIVAATLDGSDYDNLFDNREAMSYFCRAYNITAYGATKQANRIKGRYKKYANNDAVRNYYYDFLVRNWPGLHSDPPGCASMDDILKSFENSLKSANQQEEDSEQDVEDESSEFEANQDALNATLRGAQNVGKELSKGASNFIKKAAGSASNKAGSGNSGSDFLADFWARLTPKEKVLIIAAAILIFLYIFQRSLFWTLVYTVLSVVASIGVLFFFFKFVIRGDLIQDVFKGKKKTKSRPKSSSNLVFKPTIAGGIMFAIAAYIGFGGIQNGGSPIVGLAIVAFGALALFDKK